MFTGIVEEVGRLRSLTVGGASAVLEVAASRILEGTAVGDSVATAGVCLTVTHVGGDSFRADAMPETVRRTSLAGKRAGDGLNLERALTLQSRLGGHLVCGHVDGVGTVLSSRREGVATVVTIRVMPAVAALCVPKGSIAVDGVSLTLVAVAGDTVTVSLVPHTSAGTTLAGLSAGDSVNLETDLIGKYVSALLRGRPAAEGLTWEKLGEAGFA